VGSIPTLGSTVMSQAEPHTRGSTTRSDYVGAARQAQRDAHTGAYGLAQARPPSASATTTQRGVAPTSNGVRPCAAVSDVCQLADAT